MNLLNTLNRSWVATILLNILFIALYILQNWFFGRAVQGNEVAVLGNSIVAGLPPMVSVAIQLIVAIMVFLWASIYLFSKYIDIISYLQFTLMMMLAACWHSTHVFGGHVVATILIFAAILKIVKINLAQNNTSNVFNALILIVLASVFRAEFVWLFPIFFVGILILEGARAKSMALALFTIVVAIGTIMGIAYLTDNTEHIISYYSSVLEFDLVQYSVAYMIDNIVFFLTIIFFIVSAILYTQTQNRFKLKTKRTISFVILIWICLTLYMLVVEGGVEIFAFFHLILTSLFVSLNFVDYNSQIKNKIFLAFVVMMAISYGLRITIGGSLVF